MNTGSPELDLIAKALQKSFGEKFVSMGPKYEKASPIPTGSASLDAITGIGGVARGRVIEIYGPESSGKTSFALYLMSQLRRYYPEEKRPQVIIDVERSINTDFIQSLGGDPEQIMFLWPDTAEQALNAIVDLNASGACSVILVDSVDGLQSQEFLNKDIGEGDMKGIAKLMGQTLRQVSKTCVEHNVSNLFINQIRDSMDMYGDKTTTPGGKALRFYATQRFEFMKQKPSPNIPNAFLWRPKLIKNKCGPPHRDNLEIDFVYAKGPDPYLDLFKYAKSIGIMRSAGTAVMYRLGLGEPEQKLCTGGQPAAIEMITADPALYEALRKACISGKLVTATAEPGEVKDGPEPTEEELGNG